MKRIKFFITLVVLGAVTSGLNGQDWPQLLGPDRNGISTQKGILKTWPQQGPEVLWTVKVGIGFGGTAIKDGKAYLLDRDDSNGDKLRCFDMANGNELWSFSYESPGAVRYPGSRSVPALDGKMVYTCGPHGQLYCIDTETHKPIWNKNVWKDFGGANTPTWGISQCPLIFGDLLIIASQTPETGVVALNKLTGELKWKTSAIGPLGYVSPALVKVGNENQVVMITAGRGGFGQTGSGGKVVGIEPGTGKILWEYTNFNCMIPAACAIDAGENRVLITGGYNAGTALLKIDKKSDGTFGVTELFRNMEVGGHTLPAILYNGNFYIQCSTNEKKDGLVCLGMDGKVKWKTGRDPIFDKGGMVLAEGLLFVTDGLTRLYLIQPDPTAFKPVQSAALLGAGGTEASDERALQVGGTTQNWAPLALADGKLIIRDQGKLVCVKVVK